MKHFQKEEVIEVINDIYDEFVDDIIKKVSYVLGFRGFPVAAYLHLHLTLKHKIL
jgi:hypothetical protein